jgi:bacterioferritin-associated ferredoxin
VNFACGSAIRFHISVDSEAGFVQYAWFRSNGCGFMLATADVLAEYVRGKRLTDLHGLVETELYTEVNRRLKEFPENRKQCLEVSILALRAAFADLRARQLEEFRGEQALICTCFGVAEETIGTLIREDHLETVEQVTRACRAGSGCGSCTFLIQEMLDTRLDDA